jgi:NAD(P)-dependent dehydrogenase (short-subunit alcohol dehydrogenase family)
MADKTVIVTGASQGIGAGLTNGFAKGDVRYVTLTYKGGEQNILIPPTAR